MLGIPEDGTVSARTCELFRQLNQAAKRNPIVCLRGETDEPFLYEDREIRVTELLTSVMQQQDFRLVLIYNAADASFSVPDSEAETWLTQSVEILETGSGKNLVPDLLNEDQPNSLGTTDVQLFAIIKKAIRQIKDDSEDNRGICVIIDRADKLFPDDSMPVSPDKLHNASQLGILKDLLGIDSPHRIILVDRRDVTSKNEELRKEILIMAIPALTSEDVARIITQEGHETSDDLLQLAQGLSVEALRDILSADSDKSLFERLKDIKEQAITESTGGVLVCKIDPLRRDQVYMNPKEWEMWEDITREIKEGNSELLEDLLLIGPPGTGKSARAELLARLLGVPFFQVNNTSSSGLAGRKEDRVRTAIETAIKNSPCVLFWDEIDKALPRTEGDQVSIGTSNDDAQVQAYLQTKLGSKEMQDVLVVGGGNDPQRMNEALVRNGRFGKKIAVLPPNSPEEQIGVFIAVKRQLKTFDKIEFSDQFIFQLIETMGSPITTGADYLALLREGMRQVRRFSSLEESLLQAASSLDFQKTPRYHDFIQLAKQHHNATFAPWELDETVSEVSRQVLSLVQWEADMKAGEEDLKSRTQDIANQEANLLERKSAQEKALADQREVFQEDLKNKKRLYLARYIRIISRKKAELQSRVEDIANQEADLLRREKLQEQKLTNQRDVLEALLKHQEQLKSSIAEEKSNLEDAKRQAKQARVDLDREWERLKALRDVIAQTSGTDVDPTIMNNGINDLRANLGYGYVASKLVSPQGKKLAEQLKKCHEILYRSPEQLSEYLAVLGNVCLPQEEIDRLNACLPEKVPSHLVKRASRLAEFTDSEAPAIVQQIPKVFCVNGKTMPLSLENLKLAVESSPHSTIHGNQIYMSFPDIKNSPLARRDFGQDLLLAYTGDGLKSSYDSLEQPIDKKGKDYKTFQTVSSTKVDVTFEPLLVYFFDYLANGDSNISPYVRLSIDEENQFRLASFTHYKKRYFSLLDFEEC